MMDKEWAILAMVVVSTFCFASAGRRWKWQRRHLLPWSLALFGILVGATWWLVAVTCALLSLSLHSGYGDHSKMTKITGSVPRSFFVAGLLWGLPSLLWEVWYGPLITSIPFYTLGWFSRNYNRPTWVICELTAGFSIGITYALAMVL